REFHVTGVQTCALPISGAADVGASRQDLVDGRRDPREGRRDAWPVRSGSPRGERRAGITPTSPPRFAPSAVDGVTSRAGSVAERDRKSVVEGKGGELGR